jgi:hypothetical protein
MDDVDDPADHTPIVGAWQATRLRKEPLDTTHLPSGQQE